VEREAFIRAICAEPADDIRRLAFADWLDGLDTVRVTCPECHKNWQRVYAGGYQCQTCDNSATILDTSNRDRAEFIRLACELHKYPKEANWLEQMPVEQWAGSAEEGELLRRLNPLVSRHTELCHQHVRGCATWSREFIQALLGRDCFQTSAAWHWGWTRGFVSHVTFSLDDFEQHAERLFRLQPIEHVILVGVVRDGIVFRTGNNHLNDIPRDLWDALRLPRCELPGDCRMRGTHVHMTEDELSVYLVAHGRRLAGLPPLPEAAAK
jgi:uncharacterized protein (TIGR02996 family)